MPVPTLLRKGFLVGEKLQDEIPLNYIMRWFTTTKDKILILQSSTGSGKSTILPPEFYLQINSSKFVACTEPRVAVAHEIPAQIIPHYENKEKPFILSYNIGIQTGLLTDKPSIPGVIYMTIGVLYSQLISMSDEDFMNLYSCIFIDEAHERQNMLDITLYLLKELVKKNISDRNCPFIVIMSATLDVYKYSKYLETNNIIEVKGQTYPINEIFIEYDAPNVYNEIVKQIKIYHENHLDSNAEVADILVFMTGISEIDRVFELLSRETKTNEIFKTHTIEVVKLTKDTLEENPQLLQLKTKAFRKIFLATNVIETGVTLDNLACVIDAGYFKTPEFNPLHECSLLITKPVTQSMHIQRKGRVGRIAPGDCITLFTKKTFDKLLKNQFPDIIKTDPIADILNIIKRLSELKLYKTTYDMIHDFTPKVVNIFDVKLFEQPNIYSIYYSLNMLYYLGAIDINGLLTPIGYIMSNFKRTSLNFIRSILIGFCYNEIAIIDLINIAAAISTGQRMKIIKNIPIFLNDDFINSIFFVEELLNGSMEQISFHKIIFEERESIIDVLILNGLNPYKNYKKRLINIFGKESDEYILNYIKKLKTCIYEGFKMNIMFYNKEKKYYTNRLGDIINEKGINVYELKPEYLVYNKLSFKLEVKRNIFLYKPEYTCILDGFVNVDLYFDIDM